MGRTGGRWRAAVGVVAGRQASRAAQMRGFVRHGMPFLLLAFLVWAWQDRLMALDWRGVLSSAADMHPASWAVALAATAVSFAAIGHYDAFVHRLLRTGLADRQAASSGMAAIAISQMAGFGLITGALTRWHLLPGLSLTLAGRVTLTVTVSFLCAWAIVTSLAVLGLMPVGLPYATALQTAAAICLATCLLGTLAALVAPGVRIARHQVEWPPLAILARLALVAAIDLCATALVLYAFLPDAAGAFTQFLPVFLLAFGTGLLFGTPGGIGPFEITLAALSPLLDAEGLAAAILCYRAAYFALPALVAVMFIAAGWLAPSGSAVEPAPATPSPARARLAETGLMRQGHLDILTGRPGEQWLTGRAGQRLVAILDPFGGPAAARAMLGELRQVAHRRGLAPVLYKVTGRTAQAARAMGWRVLPVAEECWLDPRRFTLGGPDRATLRRKLRHAEKAGVAVTVYPPGAALPMDQMACVNRDWAGRHGGERGFSMGRFAPGYVAGQRSCMAWAGGRLLAFVTFHEGAEEWTLDLVRQRADAPDGTVPALILAAVTDAARVGLPRLSLAARPLPGCGLTGPVGGLVERFAARSGAEGLRRFKAMFAPHCTRLYLAAPNRLSLMFAAAEIARAVRWPGSLPDPAPAGALPAAGAHLSRIQLDPEEVEFDSCRAA